MQVGSKKEICKVGNPESAVQNRRKNRGIRGRGTRKRFLWTFVSYSNPIFCNFWEILERILDKMFCHFLWFWTKYFVTFQKLASYKLKCPKWQNILSKAHRKRKGDFRPGQDEEMLSQDKAGVCKLTKKEDSYLIEEVWEEVFQVPIQRNLRILQWGEVGENPELQ